MQPEKSTESEQFLKLKKSSVIKNVIIGVLILGVVGLTIYSYNEASSISETREGFADFRKDSLALFNPQDLFEAQRHGLIDSAHARLGITKYRNRFINVFGRKAYGVYHDTTDVKEYTDSIISFIRKRPTTVVINNKTYSWKFGFYYMMYRVNGSAKITFCFAPMLVNVNNPSDVYDYFDRPIRILAEQPRDPGDSTNPYDSAPLYDDGEMWP